jgi:adenosylcobalamin-dependent ribonucleoside-triphosphate reductase
MKRDGEPGFWNSSLSAVGEVEPPFTTNPCGEVPFGQWDVCNLGHINLERFPEDTEGALEAFRLMTRFLIRATFGDIMNPHQKAVVSKNRRIGVGFFGYHHWVVYQGFRFSESHHITAIREKMRGFYDVCRKEAREYAFKLRIPEPIKVTCVAPTGSISLMPGVTSGCQPIFARYYLRRVRYADTDANLKGLMEKGYPIEPSVNEPNTKIVSFFCKDPLVASCEERGTDLSLVEEQSEISLSDHLAVQSMIQNEFADNAISYTINFDPKRTSTEEIVEILKVHLPHLKGTTLMPEGNSRPQMPFERIAKEQFEEAEGRGIGRVSDKEMECLNGACPVK